MYIKAIETELKKIIDSTKTLDYPFLASPEKKDMVTNAEREMIDWGINAILEKYSIEIEMDRAILWKQSYEKTESKFLNLSKKSRINSFFLQEVMHEYAECQANQVLNDYKRQTVFK